MTDLNLTLIISLINLGLLGSFTHCTLMCGPFVLTQVGKRLQQTSLENFSNFTRLKNLALLPYHLGRITTYSVIGFLCSYLNQNLQKIYNFKILSSLLLLIAMSVFLNLIFDIKINFRLRFKSKTIKNTGFIAKLSKDLFKDPSGTNGYLLGLLLGFLPCGLLYGAFAIAATISNPFIAWFGMILFGTATIPALFLTGCLSSWLKILQFKTVTKIFALINATVLLLVAIKIII